MEFESELNSIMSWWSKKMIDPSGGFYGRIAGNGKLDRHADKAVILNTRILWAFSSAYRLTTNSSHKLMADRAYKYLIKYFVDKKNGGVFWMLNSDGSVLNNRKQIYAQAFAIYALSEYHQINPFTRAKDLAIEIFHLIERYSFDQVNLGYYEALDVGWRSIDDVRLSEKDLNAPKSMNTNLHVLEAYTNLYRIWPDSVLGTQLTSLLELMLDRLVRSDYRFDLFFTESWNPMSDTVSYGHDIEGSWLMCEAAEVLGKQELVKRTQSVALKMVDASAVGLDLDGGLMNEGIGDKVIDTDKHWWPQAEALVGFVNAFQINGDQKYMDWMVSTWRFIEDNLKHPEGEWFWKVDQNGADDPTLDLAGPWKCPYHNGRAMIEVINRLKVY